MTATQGVAVANAKEKEPELDKDEDKSSKCEQLARNPPGVEEIRRTPDLEIESRELRIERSADSYRWVVHRVLGSSPAGWHKQIALDKLHFSPPLQYLLPDKDPKFLAYVASAPQTPAESEQTISVADDFGQRVGNFDWRERQYTYTISKVLPCFPEPEE